MLSILILSSRGEGYELANKLTEEDHIVKFWSEESFQRPEGSSVVQVDRFEEHLQAADMVLDASGRYGGLCEELRERGKVVMGGRLQTLVMFDERYAKEIALNILELPPAESCSEAVYTLGGWYNGSSWQDAWSGEMVSRMLDKDRGPLVGDMGCVVWRELGILAPLELILNKAGFKGFISLIIQVKGSEIEFVAFDASLSSLALLSSLEPFLGSLGLFIYKVVTGKEYKPIVQASNKCIGVKALKMCEAAKLSIELPAKKHCWISIEPGVLGYVTAQGEDVREARRRVYRTLDNVASVEVVHRTDIGCKEIISCH